MHRHVPPMRAHRRNAAAKRVRRAAHVRLPALRPGLPSLPRQLRRVNFAPPLPESGFQPDPYVDYVRVLTEEGGILIAYKDLDTRWRHLIWRILACAAATGLEGWYLLHHSPSPSAVITFFGWAALGIVNWLIVAKPVELYRRIEIRPDCLIIDGAEVFWRRHMEGGLPVFGADEDGNRVLRGIYGTRRVDYLTVRSFDEFDGTPDIFAGHLQQAMQQLWSQPE